MKNLMKFGLGLALCGMFVACDDSGSSASDESNSSSEVILSSSSSSHSELVSESTSSSSLESVDPVLNQVQDDGPQGDESSSSSVAFGTMVDSRDNQTYKTVTIGTQTWMAENLNYAYNEPTATMDSSSFCYNNSADSCSKYGRLYLWSAAMDSSAVFSAAGKGCGYVRYCGASGNIRGICPEGWHLPSDDEWSKLFTAVGGDSTAGTVLESTSGWYSSGNGEDSYGFSVLPAGYRGSRGYFYDAGDNAYFWGSTEGSSDDAYYCYFIYSYARVRESSLTKYYAFSVRCVKD